MIKTIINQRKKNSERVEKKISFQFRNLYLYALKLPISGAVSEFYDSYY